MSKRSFSKTEDTFSTTVISFDEHDFQKTIDQSQIKYHANILINMKEDKNAKIARWIHSLRVRPDINTKYNKSPSTICSATTLHDGFKGTMELYQIKRKFIELFHEETEYLHNLQNTQKILDTTNTASHKYRTRKSCKRLKTRKMTIEQEISISKFRLSNIKTQMSRKIELYTAEYLLDKMDQHTAAWDILQYIKTYE